MEQGPDFWSWLDQEHMSTTKWRSPLSGAHVLLVRYNSFSYHCVHSIHAKMFSIQMLLHFSQIVQRICTLVLFILSVCLSVCLCVCFPYSGTSRNQAYKEQYQRLQRDTGIKYKKGFFFKTLRSEVMASFTHLE